MYGNTLEYIGIHWNTLKIYTELRTFYGVIHGLLTGEKEGAIFDLISGVSPILAGTHD